jgi:hypothetical protein
MMHQYWKGLTCAYARSREQQETHPCDKRYRSVRPECSIQARKYPRVAQLGVFVGGEGIERCSHVQQVAPSRRCRGGGGGGGGGHVVAVFLVVGM